MKGYHSLEGDSIDFSYGSKEILSGIYLKIETGSITGLLGRNGAGKSTLLNILFGSANAGGGSIRWNSQYLKCAFERPAFISYMPQLPCIPGHLTFKNLIKLFSLEEKINMSAFENDLVKKHLHTPFSYLSTGERKLMEVILFLCKENHFVLLDEPFSFLSPIQIEWLKPIIKEQSRRKGILLTDHQYQHVMDISGEVLLLKDTHIYPASNIEQLKSLGYLH